MSSIMRRASWTCGAGLAVTRIRPLLVRQEVRTGSGMLSWSRVSASRNRCAYRAEAAMCGRPFTRNANAGYRVGEIGTSFLEACQRLPRHDLAGSRHLFCPRAPRAASAVAVERMRAGSPPRSAGRSVLARTSRRYRLCGAGRIAARARCLGRVGAHGASCVTLALTIAVSSASSG